VGQTSLQHFASTKPGRTINSSDIDRKWLGWPASTREWGKTNKPFIPALPRKKTEKWGQSNGASTTGELRITLVRVIQESGRSLSVRTLRFVSRISRLRIKKKTSETNPRGRSSARAQQACVLRAKQLIGFWPKVRCFRKGQSCAAILHHADVRKPAGITQLIGSNRMYLRSDRGQEPSIPFHPDFHVMAPLHPKQRLASGQESPFHLGRTSSLDPVRNHKGRGKKTWRVTSSLKG